MRKETSPTSKDFHWRAARQRRTWILRPRGGRLPLALLAALALAPWLASPPLLAQFPPETILDEGRILGRTYSTEGSARGIGRSLAGVGDVTGDGRPDIVLGADGNGAGVPGRAFLVPGGGPDIHNWQLEAGRDGVVELKSGSQFPDQFASFAAPAGDVDGDGIGDFLLGMSSRADPEFPQAGVFLIFGSSHFPGSLNLSTSLASRGIFLTFSRPGPGGLGRSGGAAGDLSGDGLADLAIGAPDAIVGSGPDAKAAGKVIILYGSPALRTGPSVVALDSIEPGQGIEIEGAGDGWELGARVQALGDADGDGKDDLALGAPGAGQGGSVFLIFGPAQESNLASPDGTSIVDIQCPLPRARFGASLSAGLDATGDGRSDLLVGAPHAEREGMPAGFAYLIAGGTALKGSPRLTAETPLARVLRGPPGSEAARSVALVPDVEGDGIADILIGAPSFSSARGAVYLIRGQALPRDDAPLEQLWPPDGWTFRAGMTGARLGWAVAGLPDRSGDSRGELLLGAPGFSFHRSPASGAVFEIYLPEDPTSPAPRNLSARILSGRRVLLTWMVPQIYNRLVVYRDGVPVSPMLPGRSLSFTDTSPRAGKNVYFVEADGQESLRSNLAEVDVRGFGVGSLSCQQLEGSTRVLLSWKPLDAYAALQVWVDGAPASGLLDPRATSFELDLRGGEHLIEVFDPLASPSGARERCTIIVYEPDLPPVEDFACQVEPPGAVRLTWKLSAAYDFYVLYRNDRRVAIVAGEGAFLDENVPPGRLLYEVRGVQANLHRSPPASCEVEGGSPGEFSVDGRVEWQGGGPIRTGIVRVKQFGGMGQEVARIQVAASGEFHAPVPQAGTYRLIFEALLDSSGLSFPASSGEKLQLLAKADASTSQPATIRVPAPVILAFLEEDESAGGPLQRWAPLLEAVRGSALAWVFPLEIPGGVAQGAVLLALRVDELNSYLALELGSAPATIHMIAHGSAGLAARACASILPAGSLGKLVLLGTPNLGTPRAELEALAESASKPPRIIPPGAYGRGGGSEKVFSGAIEQTGRFAGDLGAKLKERGRAEFHLVAGIGGSPLLDSILGCSSHDDRVCEESALGGVPGAVLHRVGENHEALGRAPASISIILDVLELAADGGGGAAAAEEQEGEAAASPEALAIPSPEPAEPEGGGAAFEASLPVSETYTSVMEMGGTGILPLLSDTSESIIIIMSCDLPGGIRFEVETPSGLRVDPPAAGALPTVEYMTYGDGEGHELQAYRFSPSEAGTYLAYLENPLGNPPVRYTLESYVASDLILEAKAEPAEVDPGSSTLLTATLTHTGLPETGAAAEARIWRPDGSLDVAALRDDGEENDARAGDGVYSARVLAGDQPGIHQIEVSASASEGPITVYRRECATSFAVKSTAATFTGVFSSGSIDAAGDGVLDGIRIESSIESREPGIFLVTGVLADLNGNPVATSSALLSVVVPGTVAFRLDFGGTEIRAAAKDGPFVLSELRLFDGSASFVPADELRNAHTTAFFAYTEFAPGAIVNFIRGDANADGVVDISDGVKVLNFLFMGGAAPVCRDASNINDDGAVDISDASYLFLFLFGGGAPVPAPFPSCGAGRKLGCESYAPCN